MYPYSSFGGHKKKKDQKDKKRRLRRGSITTRSYQIFRISVVNRYILFADKKFTFILSSPF
jgi:hypothetical protein